MKHSHKLLSLLALASLIQISFAMGGKSMKKNISATGEASRVQMKTASTTTDVFIDTSNSKTIYGMNENGTKKALIRIEDIPNRKNLAGETMPDKGCFSFATLSKDQTKIALIINSSGVLDPGWAGVFYLKTKTLKPLDILNAYEAAWSPNSDKLAIAIINSNDVNKILLFEETKNGKITTLVSSDESANEISNIREIEWGRDNDSLSFISTSYTWDQEMSHRQERDIKHWHLNLKNKDLKKSN